jgi:hypothetical protein
MGGLLVSQLDLPAKHQKFLINKPGLVKQVNPTVY